VPKSWSLVLSPRLKIDVHHHIYYPSDAWLFSCFDLCIARVEAGTDIEAAKAKAIKAVRARLNEHIEALNAYTPQEPKP
jgi:hypothetical protein